MCAHVGDHQALTPFSHHFTRTLKGTADLKDGGLAELAELAREKGFELIPSDGMDQEQPEMRNLRK